MAAKTVLITGTSSGIGHSLARDFLSRGYRVFATARKTESIKDLQALGIETFSLEVNSKESIDVLKSDIAAKTGGRLDILLNNAGRNCTIPALEVPIDEMEMTFQTNLFAVMRMCQAFAPLLIEAKGTIVQIGSVAGIIPYVFGSTYNASKAALHSYSDTLRVELAPFDVRVVVVVTGGVTSNIARTDRQLASNSIYLPINEEYQRRVSHSQANGMNTDAYARSVVSQLLSWRKPNTIWEGGRSYVVWFISTFLPSSVFRFWMTNAFKLWKLRQSNTKRLS